MNGTCRRQKGNRKHVKGLVRKPQGTKALGRARHKWKHNIKMNLRKWDVSAS
jgi:hypothetical protein